MGMIQMKTIALYDKTCSLCKESKRLFQKMDWCRRVEWISLQEYEQMDKTFPLNEKDLRRELHLITSSGKIVKGFYAIRYLLLLFPLTMLVGLILYIPFTPVIGKPIYRLIARNRYRFLKGKCESGSCSL